MTRKDFAPHAYEAYDRNSFESLPQVQLLSPDDRLAIRTVSAVFPFRTNNYVVEELIDWSDLPDDPIFRLTFPHRDMLDPEGFDRIRDLICRGAPQTEIDDAAREIQLGLNPHPGAQMELNVPEMNGQEIPGMQHKYQETILFFPSQGQTCHAYCAYCFRWPQFVGLDGVTEVNGEKVFVLKFIQARDPSLVGQVFFARYDPTACWLDELAPMMDEWEFPFESGYSVALSLFGNLDTA